MKRILFRLTFLVTLLYSISNVQAQSSGAAAETGLRTASISGLVTVSGKPRGNVAVSIIETNRGGERVRRGNDGDVKPPLALDTTTSADGRYRFSSLPAGTYRIKAISKAFTMAESEVNADRFVVVDDGEAKENVNLSLIRGGVITGRITDSEGKPLIAAKIDLRIVRKYGGSTEFEEPIEAQSGWDNEMYQTDDRGIYRIYGLPKGRYIVGTGGQSFNGRPNPASHNYDRIWYPNTIDVKQAKVLDIDDSVEVTDIDLRLGDARKTYEVIGRVVDAETGAPVPRVHISCFPMKSVDGSSEVPYAQADSQGGFRLAGLTNGEYGIHMSASEPDAHHYLEHQTFMIADGNLEGLELKAKRGATISGIIVFEGKPNQTLWVNLKRYVLAVAVVQKFGNSTGIKGAPPPKIEDDGSFRASGIPPGRASFRSSEQTIRPWRLLRVEHNGADARGGIEVATGQTITGVRIVFAEGKGVIRGQVQISGGALPENGEVSVFAKPVTQSEDLQAWRSFRYRDGPGGWGTADNKGRFVIEGLLPGEYELRLNIYLRLTTGMSRGLYSSSKAEQSVTVTNGVEASATITVDLSKIKQGRQQ